MSMPQQLPQAQSNTPASSTYSQSNSSQRDPSSPPHFSSDPSVGTTMYQTNTTSNRNPLDPLDHVHPHSQPFRTSTAFNPSFSTNPGSFSPNAFSPLGPSSNQTQQQQQQQQHRQQYQSLAPFPSQFSQSQQMSNYPTKADVFGTSDRYEYDSFSDNGPLKQQHAFNAPFPNSVGSSLLQSQQVQLPKQQQTYVNGVNGNGVSYLNGAVQGPAHHPNIQGGANGMAFGAPPHGGQHPVHHGPGPGPGPGPGSGPPPQQQQGLPQQQQGQHPAQQQQQRSEQSQEEISTIFVVGFPEDMQEREFQNMFTFSVGFEAATLKIPNKDSSAYGPPASASGVASSLRQAGFLNTPYAGSQDPYNLVTVNSGGIVVDGPQGTSSSWQQQQGASDSYTDPVPPPRKQIIGFAKFRTRQEALEARDILQGRRVDIEKGAVLKAEMAKKNLHTKRGVGPLGLPMGLGGGAGVPVPVAVNAGGVPEMGYNSSSANETLSARERELGTLGAMGLGVGLNAGRNEEDRKRKERETERNSKLRMSNATLYDAFHAVGNTIAGGSNAGNNGRVTNGNGPSIVPNAFSDTDTVFPGYGFQSNGSGSASAFQTSHTFTNPEPFGQASTWGLPNKPSDASQSQSQQKPVSLPPRPPSSQSSPPHRTFYGSDSSAFSPSEVSATLPAPIGPVVPADGSRSGSSSVTGSQGSLEGEFARTLSVSTHTHQGMTSPQLPSPGSGGSSNNPGRGNASDQNPPINTLYVGNLPNTPAPPGYPPNYLEDYLRNLFSQCPGYRKLCFRQKSNGPMCFVEFEDVNYATRALNDLYGNQLNGLVKGGIRLSFSKNPLGVRPPPSTTNNHQGPNPNPRKEWNGQMQQRVSPGMNYAANDNTFQPRQQHNLPLDVGAGRPMQTPSQQQQQNDIVSSPPPSYTYGVSSPPSRLFSLPPQTSSFSAMGGGQPSKFPRSVSFGVGLIGSQQYSPPSSYNPDGDERLRFRETPPQPSQFVPSPSLEASTRVL